MIELKQGQVIQTRSGTNYIIKSVLHSYGGVIAVTEDGYEVFIYFKDFKIIFDAGEGGADELCGAN